MNWFKSLFGKPLRGRIHRMSVTKGGEVSVVVRFVNDPRARELRQGALLDVVPHTAGKAAEAIQKQHTWQDVPGWTKPKPPHEKLALYAGPRAEKIGEVVVPPGTYNVIVKGQKTP